MKLFGILRARYESDFLDDEEGWSGHLAGFGVEILRNPLGISRRDGYIQVECPHSLRCLMSGRPSDRRVLLVPSELAEKILVFGEAP